LEFDKPLDEARWRELKGRCISCGYLGKRSLYYDEVYEANDHDRSHFSFVSNTSPINQFVGTLPCCFVNELPLSKKFRDLEKKYGTTKDNSEISMEITARDIKCPKWTHYQSFRTPKEHFEGFKMLELEQRREEFEQRIEKERKEFELRLDELNRKERKRTDKVMKWLAIAAIIFAVAEVVAALLGITSDSWILRFFR